MKSIKSILKYFTFSMVLVVLLMGGLKPLESNAIVSSVNTIDGGTIKANLTNTAKSVADWAKDRAATVAAWLKDQGAALAYRKALDYFLQQLAYDTATYLATGDKGQSPMFYTENWGDYLANIGDNAVGHFLEELGDGGPVKFDLCDPGIDVTMKIGLGIMKNKNPREPDCTFTEMKDNWDAELQRPDFLNRFGNMFEPSSNDFGIALSLHGEVMEQEIAAKELSVLTRETNDGFKDVTESISGMIKTPSTAVKNALELTQDNSTQGMFEHTGFALADAIDVFANTLVSKLMKEWLEKGLSRSVDDTSYTGDWGGYSSGSYSGSSGNNNKYIGGPVTGYFKDNNVDSGVSVAKEQFKSIIEPNFSVRGDYEALNELVTCSNPTNAKTNECVMTENLRQAIENRMTVAEAATKKYINKDGVFGFRADGLEPNFNEGIPYRSMIIMRKYRIIPVGWELAAQYIMDNQNSLQRSLSLYDMIACFDPSNGLEDRYHGYQGIIPGSVPPKSWCAGLVDPTWVLKAPQNFCKREGPGPYVISSHVSGDGPESKLNIARDDSYCADEQTCIKENDDGSCELYGYCTEDRRKYNFGGESCDSIYNTCQSFRAEDGRTIALLENTLDYGTDAVSCTAENAGCQYFKQAVDPSAGGDGLFYASSTDKVDWELQSGSINLDYSAKECESENEGCHEFIRTKSGFGANLLTNASFEEGLLGWEDGTGTIVNDSKEGYSALRLASTDNIDREFSIDVYDISVGDTSFDLNASIVTLSLYVKECSNKEISIEGSSVNLEATDWRLITLTHSFESSMTSSNIITTGDGGCTIDAIKLEITDPGAEGRPTRFTNYLEAGLVYQKLIPAYLYESCYEVADGNGFIEPKSDAPSICDSYVRYCTAAEMNCELYQSVSDNFSVPAAVTAEDYCPAECVGYDEYQQTKTNFEDTETEYFIPDTAKTCSALVAGCDGFTNLDEIDDPEAQEYFVHMRQCVNPDSVNTCDPFFIWEGTDETGYQLRVHQLDTAGGDIRRVHALPACSTNIADGEPLYDADCREFYDSAGNVTYELYYNTYSCTDDCHPYRRTAMETDIDREEADCVYGNGEWRSEGYCIYMGVPSEGVTCQAEEAGCREYNGNAGANTRIIFEHSFENGTNQDWLGGVPSNDSVIAGEHSLEIIGSASLILGGNLQAGKSYVLQFLALGASLTDIGFSGGAEFDVSGIDLDDSTWGAYEVNIDNLGDIPENEYIISEDEALVITGNINIDNIRLTEVIDRHYLIEDSWEDNCNEVLEADGTITDDETYYAGCDAYTDRDNMLHNLFQFNHLCSDSAVGCELMIDTHNSTDYGADSWFTGSVDEKNIPADSYIYVVYDNDKTCAQQDKGCERLGLEYNYEYPSDTDYSQYFDNYKLNNPDIYNESLCEAEAVSCDAWESRNGNSYFKDPADMVCEWRVEDNFGIGSWNWLKKEVKRCDVNNNGEIDGDIQASGGVFEPIDSEKYLCADAADCGIQGDEATWCESDSDCDIFGAGTCVDNKCRYSCVMDTNDYFCLQDNHNYGLSDGSTLRVPPKTIGHGGFGGKIEQPLGGLENDYLNVFGLSSWTAACPSNQDDCTEYIDPESTASFDVDTLEYQTLYVADTAAPTCANGNSYVLNRATNRLVQANPVSGDVFYYVGGECKFNADSFSVRRAIVDYQLAHTLDKSTCNGMVDLEQNCILLNERNREGVNGMSDLVYDADANRYMSPKPPFAGDDANVLLKVAPDRACNSWLSCRSFIKDEEGNDVCYDVGACERLDANGNCSYFTPSPAIAKNQEYPTATFGVDDISNMTGYSRVGHINNNSLNSDYYSIGDMSQEGQLANVPNGSFERYDDNMYPVGWSPVANADWERDMFRVVNNPIDAQTEGIDYPMDGGSFLKFGAKDAVRSEPIALVSGLTYSLTLYVNTKNLASGNVYIDIINGAGVLLARKPVNRSEDWGMHLIRFVAGADEINNRVQFSTSGGDGNVYVDNVQIKPTLNSREEGGQEWQTLQSCRLYPETSSLSCDYYDDSGHRKKGWPGYCLEYDRAPGDPDACLMWYPVDRVNGDGVEEGGGYIDREPLYYCVGTTGYLYGETYLQPADKLETETLVEKNNFGVHSSGDIDITHRNPYGPPPDEPDANTDEWTLGQLGLGNVGASWLKWDSISHIRIRHTSPSVYCEGKLSPEWDNYYRFDKSHPGNNCDGTPTDDDCAPWGTEHVGGSPEPDDMEWWEWWGTISGFGWLFYDEEENHVWDEHSFKGGIRMLGADSFTGIETSNVDKWCNHPDYHILEVVIFPNVFFCSDIIQTVTPMGQSQHYSANVYEGSNLGSNNELRCNSHIPFALDPYCDYMSDLAPFGAVAQPGIETNNWAIMSNPYMWDSREGIEGQQPLFYEIPNGSMFNSSMSRMGQEWSWNGSSPGNTNVDDYLFAKYYGRWTWQSEGASQIVGHYQDNSGAQIGAGGGLAPIIANIWTVPSSGSIRTNQLVNLRFTTDVDKNHLPLTMYTVEWGDGTVTSVSGVEMRDRPEVENPHTMYHIYSEVCDTTPNSGHTCAGSPSGYVIRITARDNWRSEYFVDYGPVIVNE